MTATVNYDDSLYYIISLARTLQNGLRLDVDPGFFRDKLVEDILFLDRTLDRVYEALRLNTYLVGRREHLRHLMRAKRAFADMVGEAIDGVLPLPASLVEHRVRLTAARDKHVGDIADIQEAVDRRNEPTEPEHMISQDEYRFLLRNDEEE